MLVQSDLTVHALHRIFQLVMQWYDYHLYVFTVGERRFEDGRDEDAEGEDARTVTIGSLDLEHGDQFTYEYDFGDGWEHDVVVENIGRWREGMWLPWVDGGAAAHGRGIVLVHWGARGAGVDSAPRGRPETSPAGSPSVTAVDAVWPSGSAYA